MSKTNELIKAINSYPNRELIFMYPNEGAYDYAYTQGHLSKVIVDEYWADGGGRVWFRHEEEDEMFDHFADLMFDDLYPKEQCANDEQMKIIDKKTEEFINKQDWKECICAFIHY